MVPINTTFRRAKDVDMLLAEYFPKGAASINQLIALIVKRKELLLPSGIVSFTPDVAIKQINEVAFICIDDSINKHATKNHVVLIKMLLMEEAFWARLKQALANNDQKEINRCIIGLNSILDNELRIIPVNAKAQMAFLKMTPEEMAKAAKLR
jgi:hypothetical protein